MQTSFSIRQFVIKRYILLSLAFITIWIFMGIGALNLDVNPPEAVVWVAISIFAGGFVGLLLLARHLATLTCQYTLSQHGLSQTWGKTFLGPTNHQYLWKNVASYKVDEDANGTLIRLSFNDKTSLTIAHSDSIDDSFAQFKDTLIDAMENYPPEGDAQTGASHIMHSPSIYETKAAKVFAVIFGIGLLVLAIAQSMSEIGWGNLNWWKTIWLYLIGIPLIIRVFSPNPGKYK